MSRPGHEPVEVVPGGSRPRGAEEVDEDVVVREKVDPRIDGSVTKSTAEPARGCSEHARGARRAGVEHAGDGRGVGAERQCARADDPPTQRIGLPPTALDATGHRSYLPGRGASFRSLPPDGRARELLDAHHCRRRRARAVRAMPCRSAVGAGRTPAARRPAPLRPPPCRSRSPRWPLPRRRRSRSSPMSSRSPPRGRGKLDYALADMNADVARPDLVVTSACDDATVGVSAWLVYPAPTPAARPRGCAGAGFALPPATAGGLRHGIGLRTSTATACPTTWSRHVAQRRIGGDLALARLSQRPHPRLRPERRLLRAPATRLARSPRPARRPWLRTGGKDALAFAPPRPQRRREARLRPDPNVHRRFDRGRAPGRCTSGALRARRRHRPASLCRPPPP